MALTILFDEDWLAEEEAKKNPGKAWERFEPDPPPKRGRKPSRHAAKTKYKKAHLVPHSSAQNR